jgi:hypothetical protein
MKVPSVGDGAGQRGLHAEIASGGGSGCSPDGDSLCLLNGRFRVTAEYAVYPGNHGIGHAQALTSDTGYFWFFKGPSVEAMTKMDSFCGSGSDNVAVYAGGLTDIQVTLAGTDTRTGLTKTYVNPLGMLFRRIRDGPFSCP